MHWTRQHPVILPCCSVWQVTLCHRCMCASNTYTHTHTQHATAALFDVANDHSTTVTNCALKHTRCIRTSSAGSTRPKQGSTSVVHSIHSTLSNNVLRQMRQPFEAPCIIAFGIHHHFQWSPGASGDAVVAKKHLVHCHGTRLQKCTVSLGSKACRVIDHQNKGLHTQALPLVSHIYNHHTCTAIMTTSQDHPMLLVLEKTTGDLVHNNKDCALASPKEYMLQCTTLYQANMLCFCCVLLLATHLPTCHESCCLYIPE